MYDTLGYGKRKLILEIINQHWAKGKKDFTYNEILFIIQEMLTQEGKQYLQHGKDLFEKTYEKVEEK
jgi:hypothetical protein